MDQSADLGVSATAAVNTITCPAQAQTIWTINVRYFANL